MTLSQLKHRLVHPKAVAFDKQLSAVDGWSKDRLADYNWQQRKALVKHCATTVPFYQRAFRDVGFEAGDLKSPDDFELLPIVEKTHLREQFDEFISSKFAGRKMPEATTGGTTGEPLRVYCDPDVAMSAISWRMLRWWGVDPTMNAGYVYRAIPKGLRKKLIDLAIWPTRRAYLSALDMTDENMRQFASALKRTRARYVIGYVGALQAFARYVAAKDIKFPDLKVIWTTSAPLPEPVRQDLFESFGCPVYTQYGSCEFYFLAAECDQQSGLHIASDVRHVEIVGSLTEPLEASTKMDQMGDIVATDLTNYAFPLLRYRLGDRGRLLNRSCPCGRPYPLMDYVRGRTSDNIQMSDGTQIPGEFWTTIFDDFVDQISAFQVYQAKDGSVTVRYETKDPARSTAATIETVRQRLEDKIQNRVKLIFSHEKVDGHTGGKTQYVFSELTGPQRLPASSNVESY
ncbi:Phenylacetate-coenzyme A ligase [Rubripirellula amarantea]|uniref:Phenylacetate-coenzyme A ligase n=1 Tax=Rubripirellula amarantea TaxID=2527999 RepID=A0A5C5WQC4_9BACT|nr:phenylacetate--CoA ligase family protein [Rubripirellula amarantea]TWT52650.1 Phenylacetate-coenzyme A ligase [Rubripirellula amarantea]